MSAKGKVTVGSKENRRDPRFVVTAVYGEGDWYDWLPSATSLPQRSWSAACTVPTRELRSHRSDTLDGARAPSRLP